LQLVTGWLPMWALYALIIGPANPIHRGASLTMAMLIAARGILIAALLSPLVRRLTDRLPWPRPVRPVFVLAHLLAAGVFSMLWITITVIVEWILRPGSLQVYRLLLIPYIVISMWFYIMIAGTIYATRATERAGRAETMAAESQLAALRSQLNPHFLFNALHTVVQLIPRHPDRASVAAEQLASLLRTTFEEDREIVSFSEERDFVERYLELERLRFGDRLDVAFDISEQASHAELPAFSLQTLVENAVRHGVSPREESTRVTIAAQVDGTALTLIVSDTGDGSTADQLNSSAGTGLKRLRERLSVLYNGAARLDLTSAPKRGFTGTMIVPQDDR
jgi:LytS/YehU family sensor histidine kinase